jgi:alkanesulfonate monooxygenase SsuD/methylene tetrahydromethanopterin reductase-like flavin-dependent oxidoreductase (luciferase family)
MAAAGLPIARRRTDQVEVSAVKFGISVMPQHPLTDDPVRRFMQCVELTIVARDAGFDAIASGHHYLSPPYQSLQNVPLLCRLAAETGEMLLCTGVVLLPLLNPVQIAEDIATLDVICGGRLIFGVGLGYRAVEYEAFGVGPRERVGRMIESLELIKRLWAEDNVSFEGKYFRVHNATCTNRPVQKPHPAIWMAANADVSVARAARLGYPWFVNPHAALPTVERQWRLYKEAAAKAGHRLPGARPIVLELHVAPGREEAISSARPYLEAKYSAYADWGQDKVLPGRDSFRVEFEKLAQDRFILGSPADVIEQLELRVERLDCNFFFFRVGWPGMENYKQLRVLEMMGEHVLPHFHKKYGRG